MCLPLLIKALVPPWGSTFMASSKPNYLQRPYLQITSYWALGLQRRNFGETETLSIILDMNKRSALNKKISSLKISIHMLAFSKKKKKKQK